MPAPWRIIENMVELRVFPLLFGDFFFFFQSLSFLSLPSISFGLPSPHNHTDIEGSLSAPLGKDPAHVAQQTFFVGHSIPIALTPISRGPTWIHFAIVIYSKRVATAPATDVGEVTHFACL